MKARGLSKEHSKKNVWWEKPIHPNKNLYDIVSGS